MQAPDALRQAAARLSGKSDTPRLDAELLLACALGIDRGELLVKLHDLPVPDVFAGLIERRAAGEPVAYITGTRDFWTISLHVTPAVLIPRPDSETLLEAAVEHFGKAGPRRILDLGTGSGALLLAALDEWRGATGLGVDISDAALTIARGNAERLGMAERAEFRLGDWGAGIGERSDLILINPPYISMQAMLPRDVAGHEPHGALFAGSDGLDDYRRIAPQLPGLLAKNGMAAIEIGFDQGRAASALFVAEKLAVRCRPDLAGRDRCLLVTA
ncbi:MAG: peptide chain release factor N(5)-glutamine methyltransferase [Alphaproteobacteria bacterium]|nr:peptide chain release factor N(5)-glutamine methyltransferase [Alphaproteobacteria bacterium]